MVVYKTTNLINGKIYIGKDINNNSDYIGSGLLLNRAIGKYGINNFKKEILESCSNIDILNLQEKYWIKFYNSTNKQIGYNISCGGDGGDTFSNNPNKEIIRKRFVKSNKEKCKGRKLSEKTKQKMKLNCPNYNGSKNPFYGKHHTPQTIQKMQEIQSNRMWNDKISKSISKKISLMSNEERKTFFGRNFNQNKSNENRRGIKMWTKSDEIKKIFGEDIFRLHNEKKSYSEISRIISNKNGKNVGWWVIRTVILGKNS